MKEVVQSLQACQLLSWRNFFDVRELLNTRARRYRTSLNFAFSWFGQFSGNNVIRYAESVNSPVSYKHLMISPATTCPYSWIKSASRAPTPSCY